MFLVLKTLVRGYSSPNSINSHVDFKPYCIFKTLHFVLTVYTYNPEETKCALKYKF